MNIQPAANSNWPSGPTLEVRHFALALAMLDPTEHGLSTEAIASVETYLDVAELNFRRADYAVVLRDGRRYLVSHVVDDEPDDDDERSDGAPPRHVETLEAWPLAEGEDPASDPAERGLWSREVDALNSYITAGR